MQKTMIKFSPVNIEERKKIDIRSGDTVRVWLKIEEKDKTRLQNFEGLVLARKHGTEPGATFTVRKISEGVGVERVFPLYSPVIDKIEVLRRAKTRRSKLYFLRRKAAKEIRRKMKSFADFTAISYKEVQDAGTGAETKDVGTDPEESLRSHGAGAETKDAEQTQEQTLRPQSESDSDRTEQDPPPLKLPRAA